MKSVEFLQAFRPGGPWTLVAIRTDQPGTEARTLRGAEEAEAWIAERSAANLYYHVNPLRREIHKKAERADVAALEYLHVDVDPAKGKEGELDAEKARILALIRAYPVRPTFVIDSGGGYQALWKLEKAVPLDGSLEAAEEAALRNLKIERDLGGDKCHNVDRILRLPGTTNWPTERKLKRGRVVAPTRVEWAHPELVYPVDKFARAVVAQTADFVEPSAAPGNIRRLNGPDDLGSSVPDWCKLLVATGKDPYDPYKYPSRSEALFACVCELVRRNVDDDVIYSVITDPSFAISESVLDKGSAKAVERYAMKQIKDAKEVADDPLLHKFNAAHALIHNVGGKCRVMEEVEDVVMRRRILSFQSMDSFNERYVKLERTWIDGDGKPKSCPASKWWLKHPRGRQYHSVGFMPDRSAGPNVLNLWRGFACEPKDGDSRPFQDFVLEVICSGAVDQAEWLLSWMARAVQRPWEPGEVAVVLRGGRGTGKTFFADHFGELWGCHYLKVTASRHLTGNFNAHFADCCMLFADEAFDDGDRNSQSVLKSLITSATLAIERKGIDVVQAPNYVHLLMASNEAKIVSAGIDERRFYVTDVSDGKQQDTDYFRRLDEWWRNGGREAFFHFLRERDLATFDARRPPQTAALQDQKERSLSHPEETWHGFLENGFPEGWATGFHASQFAEAVRKEFPRVEFSGRAAGRFLGRGRAKLSLNLRSKSTAMGTRYFLEDIETERKRWKRIHPAAEFAPIEQELGI